MNGGNKKTEEQEYRATRGNKGNYSLKKSLVTPVPKVFPPPPHPPLTILTSDKKIDQQIGRKAVKKIGQNFGQNFWQKRRTIKIGRKFALM